MSVLLQNSKNWTFRNEKVHKLSAAQLGIILVPCLVWRHARACDVVLLFSKIQRFCADTFVLDLSCASEASLPLLHTSKTSKRIIYIFPLQIFFLKLPPLSQCSMLPDQLPLPINIWDDSLDTAVGGGGSVGHHLALARDVIVAGERGVVGHQPVLGGHVLWGVGAVWLGVVTLQHRFIADLFSHDINRILYLGWNHGSLEVGRLIFRQCRFSPEVWSNYLQPRHYKQFCFRVKD